MKLSVQITEKMDARIIRAIVLGDVELAEAAIDQTETNDLNFLFKNRNKRASYTILDVAINEALDNDEGKKQIVRMLRLAGAKTFAQLSNKGKPPLYSKRKRNAVNMGIAMTKKNRRTVANNLAEEKNLWASGI